MSMPSYMPAAQPKKSRISSVITVVLVAMLITAGLALFLQYRQTTQAVDSRDAYKVALKHTNATLTQSNEDLRATKTQVTGALNEVEHYKSISADKDEQLDACALVVVVADHEQHMALLAMQASSDYTDSYYGAALAKYNRIEDHMNGVQSILDSGGYSDTTDLFNDCDPASLVS
jgi:hypothetical protein